MSEPTTPPGGASASPTKAQQFCCGSCYVTEGQPHLPGCPEGDLRLQVRRAIAVLVQLDLPRLPLAVAAAVGILRAALGNNDQMNGVTEVTDSLRQRVFDLRQRYAVVHGVRPDGTTSGEIDWGELGRLVTSAIDLLDHIVGWPEIIKRSEQDDGPPCLSGSACYCPDEHQLVASTDQVSAETGAAANVVVPTPRNVKCPTCAAPAGTYCVQDGAPTGSSHRARWEACGLPPPEEAQTV